MICCLTLPDRFNTPTGLLETKDISGVPLYILPEFVIPVTGIRLRLSPVQAIRRIITTCKSDMQTRTFQMRVPEEFLKIADDWRHLQDDLPSRAEAIGRLVEKGLDTETGA